MDATWITITCETLFAKWPQYHWAVSEYPSPKSNPPAPLADDWRHTAAAAILSALRAATRLSATYVCLTYCPNCGEARSLVFRLDLAPVDLDLARHLADKLVAPKIASRHRTGIVMRPLPTPYLQLDPATVSTLDKRTLSQLCDQGASMVVPRHRPVSHCATALQM
jgi:hypothetical protein